MIPLTVIGFMRSKCANMCPAVFPSPVAVLQRLAAAVMRPDVVAVAFGTAFAIAVVSICGLLAAQGRTSRAHKTALLAAQVRF